MKEGGGGGGRGGRKPECLEKTSDDELQEMPQTKARKFNPPTETRTRTGDRLGKQTC